MLEIFLEKIMPILIFFLVGYFLKIKKIFSKEDGGVFLKLIFYILLPGITLLSMGRTVITKELIVYPSIAILLHIVNFILGKFLSKFLKLEDKPSRVLRGGIMIMNMSFVLPFFLAFYGESNIYIYSLFDAGNLIVISSVVYHIFVSDSESSLKSVAKTLSKSPLIWALLIGILMNIFKIKFPIFLELALSDIVKISGPLIMIALGIYFTPKFERWKLGITIVGVKMISILIIGTVLGKVFNVDKIMRDILLLAAFSPIGNNVLTYTFISDGDMELASTTVSISIIVSFIMLSIILVTGV